MSPRSPTRYKFPPPTYKIQGARSTAKYCNVECALSILQCVQCVRKLLRLHLVLM